MKKNIRNSLIESILDLLSVYTRTIFESAFARKIRTMLDSYLSKVLFEYSDYLEDIVEDIVKKEMSSSTQKIITEMNTILKNNNSSGTKKITTKLSNKERYSRAENLIVLLHAGKELGKRYKDHVGNKVYLRKDLTLYEASARTKTRKYYPIGRVGVISTDGKSIRLKDISEHAYKLPIFSERYTKPPSYSYSSKNSAALGLRGFTPDKKQLKHLYMYFCDENGRLLSDLYKK